MAAAADGTLSFAILNKEQDMNRSQVITHVVLVALTSLTFTVNAEARGGGGGMGGLNTGLQQGNLNRTRTRTRDKTTYKTGQETRALTQERVRVQDGNGAMEQRRETRIDQKHNRQQPMDGMTPQ